MKKKTPAQTNREIIDSYDYLGNAASTTDCTGLIPSAPQTSAELESYEELYAYQPPHMKNCTASDAKGENPVSIP